MSVQWVVCCPTKLLISTIPIGLVLSKEQGMRTQSWLKYCNDQ